MDVKVPVAFPKDSLFVAGKTKQGVKLSRRDLIKPSLFSQFPRPADTADNHSNLLLRKSISNKVKTLKK